jgi:hypothetical protein
MAADLLIDAEEALHLVREEGATLVCAYDDPLKCMRYFLEHSISLPVFRARSTRIPAARDVIFYCACEADAAAVRRARDLRSEGKENVYAIAGGYDAAIEAGMTTRA